MDEQNQNIRPTKKQQELLIYIEAFIAEHGYSPSYREIMAGCNYTSVATVALHVNNLIKRGHLVKREHNARSIEVVNPSGAKPLSANVAAPTEEKWLIQRVEHLFAEAEQAANITELQLDELNVLIRALQILGMEVAAESLLPRLSVLREHSADISQGV